MRAVPAAASLFVLAAACAPSDASPTPDAAPSAAAWSDPAPLPPLPPGGGEHVVSGLAAKHAGRAHAVFLLDTRGDGRFDRVVHAGFDGRAWSEPRPLDGGAALAAAADVAVDGDGAVHVVWMEGRSGAGLDAVVHRVLRGGAWSAPDTLYREPSRYPISAPFLSLAADRDGGVHLLHARTDRGFAHAVLREGRWSHADTDRGGGYVRWGSTAAGEAFVFVASDLEPGERSATSDVWFRQREGGGWAPAVRVHRSGGYAYEPQLATDGRGTLHVVWREGERPLHANRVLHATSPDGWRWSAPREIAAAASVHSTRLGQGAAGEVHLTFSAVHAGKPGHHHLRLDGAAAPEPLFPQEPPPAGTLEAAADGSGTIHGLWRGPDGRYLHSVLRP